VIKQIKAIKPSSINKDSLDLIGTTLSTAVTKFKGKMAPNDEEKSGEEETKNDEAGKEQVGGVVFEEEGAIMEATDHDVISGRGAAVNLNPGNRRFRDLCFKRKPEFDAASHAAKRRIATEIVVATKAANGRFLKRKVDKGPWYEMSDEKALLKACQVMRDYQRPDRVALRQSSGNGRKRQRLGESLEPAPVRQYSCEKCRVIPMPMIVL
jgi:hypothetical protein